MLTWVLMLACSYGDRKEFGKTHTICTWQSLNILLKKTKNAEAPNAYGGVYRRCSMCYG